MHAEDLISTTVKWINGAMNDIGSETFLHFTHPLEHYVSEFELRGGRVVWTSEDASQDQAFGACIVQRLIVVTCCMADIMVQHLVFYVVEEGVDAEELTHDEQVL